MQFSIYRSSQRIGIIEGDTGDTARISWQSARAAVRALAHADGVEGQEDIYQTANRAPCVARGIYRAVPTIANRACHKQA